VVNAILPPPNATRNFCCEATVQISPTQPPPQVSSHYQGIGPFLEATRQHLTNIQFARSFVPHSRHLVSLARAKAFCFQPLLKFSFNRHVAAGCISRSEARRTPGIHMPKVSSCLTSIYGCPAFLAEWRCIGQEQDDDRLRTVGSVLKEFSTFLTTFRRICSTRQMRRCLPSVLKAASSLAKLRRGAMSCRKGEDFRGTWGAPTMIS